jgi:hypothetical protein
LAGGAAIVVRPGTTKTGDPLIVDVIPINPDGASDKGIIVAPGITTTGLPPTTAVEKSPPGFGRGFSVGLGSVVADGTTKKLVPPISVVLP